MSGKRKGKRRGRAPKRQPRVSRVKRSTTGVSPGVVITEVGQPSPYTTSGMQSTYTPQHAERAYTMAAGGATDAEIAAGLGIAVSTFYTWRHLYPDFLAATQLGSEAKGVYDQRVENALLSRAVGHQHPAVKIFCTREGEIIYAPYTEYLPPDVNAARHWLNNRNPDRWKEKVEVDGSHEVTVVVKGGLPDDDEPKGGGDAKT